MTNAYFAALSLGALGAASRFAQGNGHGGPGRWSLVLVCQIAAAYVLFGLGRPPTIAEAAAAVFMGGMAAANIALGYTRWENLPWSLARYTGPALLAVLPWVVITGRKEAVLYALVGPLVALNQFCLAERKPDWLKRLVGNRDVATIRLASWSRADWRG